MRKIWFLLALLCVSSEAQQPSNWTRDWPAETFQPFEGDIREVIAGLRTSWTTGENHQGKIRYIVEIDPVMEDSARNLKLSPESVGPFVRQIDKCRFYLDLYDYQGFRLKILKLYMQTIVDDKSNPIHLVANGADTMSAEEYRSLLGEGRKTGSWDMSYDCPGGRY